MKIEPLTRELYIKYDDTPPPVTMRGVALTDNEKVYAMLAIAVINNKNFIVCGTKQGARKRDIIAGWHEFKEKFMHENKEYYALIDDELKTAPAFLNHFGFEKFKDDIYIYRG